MQDFEVHPINTHLELRLARNLVTLMLEEQAQWGNIYPRQVTKALEAIHNFYKAQLEQEQ